MNKKISSKKDSFSFVKDKNEREEMYQERRRIWSNLTSLKKALIVALLLSFILFIAISFYFMIRDVSSIPTLSLDEYDRIVRLIDNEKWDSDRSNLIKLRKIFSGADGCAETKREGSFIILYLSGKPFSEKYVFMFSDGKIKERSRDIYLHFTESDEGTGRALLLEGPFCSAVLNLVLY